MRPPVPWLLISLSVVAAGCEMFAYADRSLIPGYQGGASTTIGAGGGSGGGSGTGGACVQVSDCPGADSECRSRVCVGGTCGVKNVAAGTPTSAQVTGDCKQIVCDGAGSTEQVESATNTFDDHNACSVDHCAAGVPENVAAAAGTVCAVGDGKVCDGAARCVACLSASQCGAGLLCVADLCVPTSCADHVKDGSETAVDCGGSSCPPCAGSAACLAASDCQSGVCTGDTCQPPSCGDGVKNGDETGVDCGGSCPKRCGYDQGCGVGADCVGGLCSGTTCLASCSDGVKNGGETGVDCGGLTCAPCSTGGGCAVDADCFHGVCRAGVCLPATCVDRMKDDGETDVDCGGGACPACAQGKACAAGVDCASGVCAGNVCAAPTCTDHVRNGTETGVDCGGPTCGPCPDGQSCQTASDCQSAVCTSGVCVAATCSDGMKDGTESDVDCGGPSCAGCAGGGACAKGSDCASTVCTGGHCTTGTCSDGIKNDMETDADCGGPVCPGCAVGKSCNGTSDCAAPEVCVGGKCAAPTCSDGITDGTETDVDCGGASCPGCVNGKKCVTVGDCQSQGCFAGTCGDQILISQVRTNGPNPDYFGDDFVELYNPGQNPVALDPTWTLWHRSAQGSCQGNELRFTGAGQVIPPHHYYLLYGLSYAGPPGDLLFSNTSVQTSIADAASLWIMHGGATVEVLCYYYDAITLGRLVGTGGCVPDYVCRGNPVSNLPHDGTTNAPSIVDAALERKPGGALGDQQDSGDSAQDFQTIMPSHPRSSASPAAP